MNETYLKELWMSANEKIETNFSLQRKNTDDITKLKIKSLLSSMKPYKVFTLMVGIIWVLTGAFIVTNIFIHGYDEVSPFFLYSAALQILLTAIAVFIYIYQIHTINNVDITKPVLETQKQITGLRLSTLWSAKILFLQLPLWTTFYLSLTAIASGDLTYILINGAITLLFTYAAIWLFRNIKIENKDKKWFRIIFNGKEWTPLMQSIEQLKIKD